MKKVIFLRDFPEDNRLSMELYADKLISNIKKNFGDYCDVIEFSPKTPKWSTGLNGLRFARYVLYPLQVIGKKASIYHIIDHAYAHLTYFLDPNKCIVTVHDLIPILKWKGKIKGCKSSRIPLLALLSFSSIKRARHIIAVSQNTKNDLINLLGIDESKISVIYSGIDPIFHQFDFDKRIQNRKIMFEKNYDKNLILITGSQFYKNHETALKTISYLVKNETDNIRIIKTGSVTKDWIKLVKFYKLEKYVINLGIIPREKLPNLYNAVDLLMFPSVYEGFGWPPLEAMACGTPVIASNAASLPEVIGDAGILHDPNDYLGFASSIMKIFSDKNSTEKLIHLGFRQIKKFNWENTIKLVSETYQNFQ